MQQAELRIENTVGVYTAWVAPLIHDIRASIGYIMNRAERLKTEIIQSKIDLPEERLRELNELSQDARTISEQINAVDLGREELQHIEIDAVLPKWIEATLAKRDVPIDLNLHLQCPGIYVSA